MKLFRSTLPLVWFLLATFLTHGQSLDFRLMSFNVQQPFGTNWDGRKDNAVTVLNQQDADVVGTQEAVNDQRDYLISNSSGYAWFGGGRDGGDAGEGSWIFYKAAKYDLDAANSGNFWLSNTPDVPSAFEGPYNRICTYVRLVDKSTGQGFYVYNAHFPTPDLYNARLASMKLLIERAASRSITSDPVYFTGDFNSNESDGVTAWMKSGADNPILCRDTYRDVDPTGNVTTGFGTKYDYVYCPDESAYTTTDAWVVSSPSGYSDHLAIAADLTWTSTTSSFEVKALSVNLWRKNNDWATRMPNVVALIEGESPDVVGLQEGDEGKQAELASNVNGYVLETGPWNDGSTSFLYKSSTISVVETGTFGYSSQPDNPNFSDWGDGAANGWLRVCNWALFEQPSTGKRFYAYNTHLDANGFTPDAAFWRSQEVRLLAERISNRTYPEYPFILIGDLNGVENEEAILYLKGGEGNPVPMVDTYREILPNGPGDSFGNVKYDYIMVAEDDQVVTLDAAIIYHAQYGWTSDHQQVVATIQFGEGGNTPPLISDVNYSPSEVVPEEEVTVTAHITDDEAIASVTLSWGYTPDQLTNEVSMNATTGSLYSTIIPGQANGRSIYFQLEAVDNDGAERSSDVMSYIVTDGSRFLLADFDEVDLPFEGFALSTFEEVNNPNPTGLNSSGRVGSTLQGNETWSGIFSATLATKINFDQFPLFSMKIQGPATGEVLIKFENSDNKDDYFEVPYLLNEVGTWVRAEVDFSGAANDRYDRLVLFFDFGSNARDTYYFDDLELSNGVVTQVDELQTSGIGFFPNPTAGNVRAAHPGRYEVYSATGALVKEFTSSLDLSEQPSGVYFIKNDEGEVFPLVRE